MKKIISILLVIMNCVFIFSSEYYFEGIQFVYSADLLFKFNFGELEISKINDDGETSIERFPYNLKNEDAYLVVNISNPGKKKKLYVFNADRKHIILFDTDSNEVIDATEKKDHIDEPWIYSSNKYTASSCLSENIKNKCVTYYADNLSIQNLPLNWVEGVEGFGKGEKLTIDNCINGSRRMYIINGFFSPEKPSVYYSKNRVKTFLINCYKNGKVVNTVEKEIKDTGTMQIIEFSERYEKFELIIQDVYYGEKYNDTALTGVFFDALDCFENENK